MQYIEVFAPGTVANLGCGFDVMGLTLDGVGDRMRIGVEPGADGLAISNRSGKELPARMEDNVITPAVMAMLEAYGQPVRVEITILEKIAPGSGIGSSAASSAGGTLPRPRHQSRIAAGMSAGCAKASSSGSMRVRPGSAAAAMAMISALV